MALMINEACTACDACEPVCPNKASQAVQASLIKIGRAHV